MKWLKSNVWNLVSVALLGLVLWRQGPVWWANKKLEGQTLAVTTLQRAQGAPLQLPDNQPAILVFWATWCAPCHVEMEHFRRAVDKGEVPGARIFAINMSEPRGTVESFWQKEKYPFELAFDDQENLVRQFNVSVTPTVVFLQANGQVETVSSGVSVLGVVRAEKLFKADHPVN